MLFGAPYWALPLLAAIVWLATLLALFISWFVDGQPQYESMERGQDIAYISDVGADRLKPLFIAGTAVTAVSFNLALIFERYLRHAGKLAPNTSMLQKVLSVLAILSGIAGGAGLVLLSIFDTRRYESRHNNFLFLFIIGFILNAIFVSIENQRLVAHNRGNVLILAAFWSKLSFVLLGIALAIAFGVTRRQVNDNAAAIIEWVLGLVFFFYLLSFVLDFLPAVHRHMHKNYSSNEKNGRPDGDRHDMAERGYADGANGHTESQTNEFMFTHRV